MTEVRSFSFLNIKIDNLSQDELLSAAKELVKARKKSMIAFANVDVIIRAEKDSYLQEILRKSDYTITDGKPLIWISQLYKRPIKEKISGADFVPALCEIAEREGYSVFLLGGAEGVPEKAAGNLLKKHPELNIAGLFSPEYGFEKDQAQLKMIREKISAASPDILIVCLGCPKQEKFIYENMGNYQAVLSVCAGATIDFLAGNVSRCPRWISNAGFEWFYRVLMEPRRLFKRYFIDDMVIFRLIFKYWPQKNKN